MRGYLLQGIDTRREAGEVRRRDPIAYGGQADGNCPTTSAARHLSSAIRMGLEPPIALSSDGKCGPFAGGDPTIPATQCWTLYWFLKRLEALEDKLNKCCDTQPAANDCNKDKCNASNCKDDVQAVQFQACSRHRKKIGRGTACNLPPFLGGGRGICL